MKTFKFVEDSWWDSICDCCKPTLMESYNSDDVYPGLGSAHSVEDCHVQALITHLGYDKTVRDDGSCDLYYLSLKELKDLCKEHKITVEIIND